MLNPMVSRELCDFLVLEMGALVRLNMRRASKSGNQDVLEEFDDLTPCSGFAGNRFRPSCDYFHGYEDILVPSSGSGQGPHKIQLPTIADPCDFDRMIFLDMGLCALPGAASQAPICCATLLYIPGHQ